MRRIVLSIAVGLGTILFIYRITVMDLGPWQLGALVVVELFALNAVGIPAMNRSYGLPSWKWRE